MGADIGSKTGVGEDPPLVVQLIIIFLFSFGLMFMGYVFLLQHKLWNCINAFPVSVRYAFFLSYLSFFGFIVYGIVPAAILQLITASLGYTVKQAHFFYFAIATSAFAAVYFKKYLSWAAEWQILSEKLEALQLPPKRKAQLLSSDVDKGYSEDLNPDTWFDIVTYISNSDDGVRSYHEKHDWLERFIFPVDAEVSSGIPEDFRAARAEFKLRPLEFIEHIRKFSELLETRDLCKLLFEHLGKSTDEDVRCSKLQSWISLQVAILGVMQSAKFSSTTTTTHAYDSESSKRIVLLLQQLPESSGGDSYSSAAGQLRKFLKRTIDHKALEKEYMIENSWREHRRRSLEDLFLQWKDQALLKEFSSLLKGWSKDPRLLSVEQDKFQSIVCLFAQAMTGREFRQYREAIQTLREMSFIENEQFKVLYKAIEKERTEVALQQQIITCLEYRFALEHLPQKNTTKMQALHGTDSGSGAWQKTWRLAVEAELDRMIIDYVNPPNPGLAGTTPATSAIAAGPSAVAVPSASSMPAAPAAPAATATLAAPSAAATPLAGTAPSAATAPAIPSASVSSGSTLSATSPSLRELLQSDFEYWAGGQQQLITDKGNKTVPSIMPNTNVTATGTVGGAAGGAAVTAGTAPGTASGMPAPPRPKRPKRAPVPSVTWTTGNFIRVEVYKPDYETWPSFLQGYNLYSELSSNIHTYRKSYDIQETNFTKSQRVILNWLNPTDAIDPKTKEVSWEKVWKNRGLPL